MLGTGLARLVIYRQAEEVATQSRVMPVAGPLESRLQVLLAAPAANAPEHAGESRPRCQLETPPPTPQSAGLRFLFSSRELEIVGRIAAGATSVDIAEQLHISVHTVKNHRKNILRKADCRNSGQLINRCIALGLV